MKRGSRNKRTKIECWKYWCNNTTEKNLTHTLTLEVFDIERFLSNKGSPYDNEIAEATFKCALAILILFFVLH